LISANTLAGRVVGVADGDTLTLLSAGRQQMKVRLNSIDAPEKKQPFGNAAKKALSDKVFNKQVIVETSKIDRYGRSLGTVWVDGRLVNLEMVKTGMAWVYRQYATDPAYYSAENIARKNKIGLWAQSNPIPPWEFRHGDANQNKPATIRPVVLEAQGLQPATSLCQGKRYCKQMTSCEEAVFYLKQCGLHSLDGNGDGVPCNKLCRNP